MLEDWEWGTYIFFAGFLAVGIVWVWFFLPETKGATLEEMDRVFNSNAGEQDSELLREAQRDVGLTSFLERLGSPKGGDMEKNEGSHYIEKL